MIRFCFGCMFAAIICLSGAVSVAHAGRGGQLTLVVTDRDTGAPIACRMHLKNVRNNQPVKPPKSPFWHDHFVIDGSITLTLPTGDYNFELERGPEYLNRVGHFTINDFADDTHNIDLKRVVDMQKEGWWSGDLYVDRPEKEMPLVLEAEDLHVAQLVSKPAKTGASKTAISAPKPASAAKPGASTSKPGAPVGKSSKGAKVGATAGVAAAASSSPDDPWVLLPGDRCFGRFGQIDSRAGNLIIIGNLSRPLELDALKPTAAPGAAPPDTKGPPGAKGTPSAKSPLAKGTPLAVASAASGTPADAAPIWDLVSQARQQEKAWIDAGRAFSWDLPLLVAEGQADSIALANSHLGRVGVNADVAGGKPHDNLHYLGASGIGRWTEEIYYHLLNCGLRIPPSAGSGSGATQNPVGYDRMYVQIEDGFTVDKWWEGFKAGRVVVTNGPLLRPIVDGEFPGHLFQLDAGEAREFEIGMILSTREQIDYFEIVENGEVTHMIRLDEWLQQKGRLPKLTFTKSGWFLVRAITNAEGTYRFASSGPYYVSVGYTPRISKASAQFFLDWINERAKNLKIANAEERVAAMKRYDAARDFWQALVEKANVE